jgi:hypothetical protein
MTDPTKLAAFDPANDPRYGALVRVHIAGIADAVFTLPPSIKSEGHATHFLFALGMKMSNVDPHAEFTDEEKMFIDALLNAAMSLLHEGLEWKTLKVLDPKEVEHVAQYARKLVQ